MSKLHATPEPRWPAMVAMLTTGLIFAGLPGYLSIGPSWLPLVIVAVVELPTMISHKRGYHRLNQVLGHTVSGIVTAFELWSLTLLIVYLPTHKETATDMLRSAALLWTANIFTFALWYWRLDGGGPTYRDKRPGHTQGAFLFPQMTWEETRGTWSPRFIDYLFLSFNTSTALSPTDAPILSRWAKALVMLQAMISLMIVVLLAARAVNIM